MSANNIARFVFNAFAVNTYVLSDNLGECIIIDPACQGAQEEKKLSDFILKNNLIPKALVYTHFHIDHIVGNNFVCNTYNLKPTCHKASRYFWEHVPQYAAMFGIEMDNLILPENFVEQGGSISFGTSTLDVLYTPGHADGSICLVNKTDEYVVTGDVLFRDSIGRTDLPTGNFQLLRDNIVSKLFTLPESYTVYPGHGPSTTIGYEKINNPFID